MVFEVFLQKYLVVSTKIPTFAPGLLTFKQIIAYRNRFYSLRIK